MWTRLQQRVSARRMQLQAWQHMMPRGVTERATLRLKRVDWLLKLTVTFATVGVFLASVDALGSTGAVVVAVLLGFATAIPASLVADLLRGKILAEAFATLSVPASNTNVADLFVASVAHKVKPAAEWVPKPQLSQSDRDAVDFDDAA